MWSIGDDKEVEEEGKDQEASREDLAMVTSAIGVCGVWEEGASSISGVEARFHVGGNRH